MINLGEDDTVIPVSGPARTDRDMARILVRLHGAPVGYVEIPFQPPETLHGRAKDAAEIVLAEPLLRHRQLDAEADGPAWVAQVICPQRFPRSDGTGISVVVCTRDRPTMLRECLLALQQATYEPLEIVVVDNAPTGDATWKVVSELADEDPRIRYTCESRPGLSNARNHGLTSAKFELVAFTDDDILVEPDWLTALAAGFAADPEAACVTGPVASRSLDTASERYFDSRYPWGDAFKPRRYDMTEHRDKSRLYPFRAGIFGTGANFAVRKAAVDQLGGFDPLLGTGAPGKGGEDLDMFLRMILAGNRLCYLPAALVWHRHRIDDEALAEQVHAYGHGLGAYLAKRLLTREMSLATLAHSASQSVIMLGQMRDASQASDSMSRGRRLAMSEAWGVLVGAFCFYRLYRKNRDH